MTENHMYEGDGDIVPFDPEAELAKLGLDAPEELPPREEETPLELTEIVPAPRDYEPPDLSAYETLGGHEQREGDSLQSPPPLVPAPARTNPKDLIGATKPDISLVPPAGMLYESQAMMDGARKYGPYNWRSNPVLYRVYIAAAMRHLQQLLDGEDFDPISGVHHIGHARACLGIMADANETGNLVDDRPVKGAAGDMIRRFTDTGSYKRD